MLKGKGLFDLKKYQMFQQWVLFVICPPFPDIQKVKRRIHP